jgi:hypothetical protein
MISKEVKQLEVGGGVRAIPFCSCKSSNVEIFEEGRPCDWVNWEGLNHFAIGSSFFIIEGLAMFTVEASTSSGSASTSTTSDFLAFGIDFLVSTVDFNFFPSFLTDFFY